ELCQTISSHSHSIDSFGSSHLSDEERSSNGTLSRVRKRPTPPLPPAQEEEEGEKSCGPAGFWEALTPCNGCHNLGFSSLSQVRTHTHLPLSLVFLHSLFFLSLIQLITIVME
uniref:Uncharacterized protein n=1 Tax=Hucho hucho TaxID=62062 RepID=A0A4W5KF66_9TELE